MLEHHESHSNVNQILWTMSKRCFIHNFQIMPFYYFWKDNRMTSFGSSKEKIFKIFSQEWCSIFKLLFGCSYFVVY